MEQQWMAKLKKGVLILLGLALIGTILLSLQWRYQLDSALLFYISFLISHFGFIPYKDIFDVNLPGSYLIYSIIGTLTNYSDIGVRIVDISILSAIMTMNWHWMKKFGNTVAWCGSILWGLLYFKFGPDGSLQREYLILLPLVGALLCYTQFHRYGTVVRMSVTGLLFGMAAMIKPHALIGLPVLVAFEFREQREPLGALLRGIVLPAIGGMLIPPFIAVIYLIQNSAFSPFISIVRNYYPLYSQITGNLFTLEKSDALGYIVFKYLQFGRFQLWLIPAGVAIYFSIRDFPLSSAQRRQFLLLLSLTIIYSFYPIFSMKFWPYHWIPFLYLLSQVASLCFFDQPITSLSFRKVIPLAIILGFLFFAAIPSGVAYNQLRGKAPLPPKFGRVDQMADYLGKHLGPNDTVQPLDWTGGAAHALLMTRAKLASPYVYDVQFYQHPDGMYTQYLRHEFINNLEKERPRFVIEVTAADKPWLQGRNATKRFDELQSFLQDNYVKVFAGMGFQILELKKIAAKLQD